MGGIQSSCCRWTGAMVISGELLVSQAILGSVGSLSIASFRICHCDPPNPPEHWASVLMSLYLKASSIQQTLQLLPIKTKSNIFFQFVKCGFAGSNFPAHIFPSMVGRPILRAVNKIGDIEVKVSISKHHSKTPTKSNNFEKKNTNRQRQTFYLQHIQFFTGFTCRCKSLCVF